MGWSPCVTYWDSPPMVPLLLSVKFGMSCRVAGYGTLSIRMPPGITSVQSNHLGSNNLHLEPTRNENHPSRAHQATTVCVQSRVDPLQTLVTGVFETPAQRQAVVHSIAAVVQQSQGNIQCWSGLCCESIKAKHSATYGST